MKNRFLVGLCLVLAPGCGLAGGDNDLRSLEVSLGSAVTLGQSASIALNAMRGSGEVRCANVVTACTDYPCAGEVEVVYGSGCPLPLGGEAVGVTTVTGTWSSENDAVLDFTFTDVRIGERGTIVAGATTIDASQADGITTVEYTGTQATTRGALSLAAASTWDVVVDDSGTPTDPSDDTYTIDGTNAGAGGASGGALTVDGALVTPDCRRNPVAGEASITSAGVTNIRTDDITFVSSCDGTARLEPTLGDERDVELDFLRD